jgi:hypothetical protein
MSPASVPSAAFALSTRVSEFAAIKGGAGLGLKATLATRRMTFTVAVALRVPAVAVTFADPTATAVTEPVVASIVRMFGLSDDHLIFRVVMALPCASSAFAISVRTSPTRKTGTASNATDVTGAKTISVSVVEDPGGNGGVGGVVCSSIGVPSSSSRVSVIPTAHCVDDPPNCCGSARQSAIRTTTATVFGTPGVTSTLVGELGSVTSVSFLRR